MSNLYSIAQFDFVFQNPTLISGVDRQVNAIYRYPLVKPGVDALITIQQLGNGATLDSLDRVAVGYVAGFQPMLRIPAKKDGYVQFKIDFVLTGTNTLSPQAGVHLTPLDVDGFVTAPDSSFEYQEINMGGGYANFDVAAGQLVMSQSGNSFIGTNIRAIDFPGIDTSITARPVMFTVSHFNVSSLTVRMGCNNNKVNVLTSRNLSVVFKDFLYSAGGILDQPHLLNLTGRIVNDQPLIEFSIRKHFGFDSVVLERSENQTNYRSIISFNTAVTQNMNYSYIDGTAGHATYYYRLKIISPSSFSEYSKVIVIKGNARKSDSLLVFPTLVMGYMDIKIKSEKNEKTLLYIFNENGKFVISQSIDVRQGYNTFSLPVAATLPKGIYLVRIKNQVARFVR